MEWVQFSHRQPPESGYYFWKGKRCGGFAMYWKDKGFDLPPDRAQNHTDSEHLYWLDETDAQEIAFEQTKTYKIMFDTIENLKGDVRSIKVDLIEAKREIEHLNKQ